MIKELHLFNDAIKRSSQFFWHQLKKSKVVSCKSSETDASMFNNVRYNKMSCAHCQELCVKYIIRAPDQLRKTIRIARDALSEGTLSEIKTTNNWNQYSFRECAEKMVWGDIVDYHFACSHCGTQFVLGAETYHGSGGYWSPENEKPSAVID